MRNHDDGRRKLQALIKQKHRGRQYLYEANLVGDVQCIMISSQPYIGLLLAIRPDEGVDLCSLDIIQFLDRILDLTFVAFDINDEDKRVVFLDLLHCALRVQRRDNRAELVHAGHMGHTRAWVLGRTSEAECLRAVE